MTTAKGLTSGYFPLSALFIGDKVWNVLVETADELGAFFHGYTYSGHPTGCAVALKNIEILERENLVERAKETGAYMHAQLKEKLSGCPIIGELRGAGLLAGLQIVKSKSPKTFFERSDKAAPTLQSAIRKEKVLLRGLPSADTIAISPSFVISEQQIDTLVAAVVNGAAKVQEKLRS